MYFTIKNFLRMDFICLYEISNSPEGSQENQKPQRRPIKEIKEDLKGLAGKVNSNKLEITERLVGDFDDIENNSNEEFEKLKESINLPLQIERMLKKGYTVLGPDDYTVLINLLKLVDNKVGTKNLSLDELPKTYAEFVNKVYLTKDEAFSVALSGNSIYVYTGDKKSNWSDYDYYGSINLNNGYFNHNPTILSFDDGQYNNNKLDLSNFIEKEKNKKESETAEKYNTYLDEYDSIEVLHPPAFKEGVNINFSFKEPKKEIVPKTIYKYEAYAGEATQKQDISRLENLESKLKEIKDWNRIVKDINNYNLLIGNKKNYQELMKHFVDNINNEDEVATLITSAEGENRGNETTLSESFNGGASLLQPQDETTNPVKDETGENTSIEPGRESDELEERSVIENSAITTAKSGKDANNKPDTTEEENTSEEKKEKDTGEVPKMPNTEVLNTREVKKGDFLIKYIKEQYPNISKSDIMLAVKALIDFQKLKYEEEKNNPQIEETEKSRQKAMIDRLEKSKGDFIIYPKDKIKLPNEEWLMNQINLDEANKLKPYYENNRKDKIIDIQKKLNELNPELKLNTDGVFSPELVNAIKEYQKNNNLSVDGMVGTQTLRKMGLIGQKDTEKSFYSKK